MFETGSILLDCYLFFILVLKLTNIFLTIFQKLILKSNIIDESNYIKFINFMKNLEYIAMSILIIILFKPFGEEIVISKYIRMFLFTFGILAIVQFMNDQNSLNIQYQFTR